MFGFWSLIRVAFFYTYTLYHYNKHKQSTTTTSPALAVEYMQGAIMRHQHLLAPPPPCFTKKS